MIQGHVQLQYLFCIWAMYTCGSVPYVSQATGCHCVRMVRLHVHNVGCDRHSAECIPQYVSGEHTPTHTRHTSTPFAPAVCCSRRYVISLEEQQPGPLKAWESAEHTAAAVYKWSHKSPNLLRPIGVID